MVDQPQPNPLVVWDVLRDALAFNDDTRDTHWRRIILGHIPQFDPTVSSSPMGLPWLHFACAFGIIGLLPALMECGASLEQRDVQNRTVLHWACYKDLLDSNLDIVSWIVKQKGGLAILNVRDNFGATALERASMNNSLEIVCFLLRNGADPTMKMKDPLRVQLPSNHLSAGCESILNRAAESWSVLQIGEWRPRLHQRFPMKYRKTLRTLVVLAKARTYVIGEYPCKDRIVSHYAVSGLSILPEELLQYLFVYVCDALSGEYLDDVYRLK